MVSYFIMWWHLSVVFFIIASQESYLDTLGNNEHAKDIYLFYKRMNDYHFEILNEMSFLILQ